MTASARTDVRFHLPHHVNLPRHIDERIVGGLIAIARRIRGRTLDVRIVVRRTGAEIQQLDSEFHAQFGEAKRLGQIVFHRIVRIHAEGETIRQAVRVIFRNAGAEFAGLRPRGVGLERNEVERAQSHADVDVVSTRANAADDFAKNARAILKCAAVFPRPSVRARETRAANNRGNV